MFWLLDPINEPEPKPESRTEEDVVVKIACRLPKLLRGIRVLIALPCRCQAVAAMPFCRLRAIAGFVLVRIGVWGMEYIVSYIVWIWLRLGRGSWETWVLLMGYATAMYQQGEVTSAAFGYM